MNISWHWLLIGLLFDVVFEIFLALARRYRRKYRMRYFCVWVSYRSISSMKIQIGHIEFESKLFPSTSAVCSKLNERFGTDWIQLKINNIYEFKNKKDYESFSN